MKYVLLTATEHEHCTSPLWHYWNVGSPVYPMISGRLYTFVPFLKEAVNVKNYSKTEVELNSILPRAYHEK